MGNMNEYLLDTISRLSHFDVRSISMETPLTHLSIDSVTLFSIVSSVESVYGFELSASDTADIFKAQLVGDLATLLQRAKDTARL